MTIRFYLRAAALLAFVLSGCATWLPGAPEVSVDHLSTESQTDPLGIDAAAPRLSWQLAASRRGVLQSAYQVRVARSAAGLEGGADLVWDSGKRSSDQSVLQPYGGPALQTGQRYWWQVRVWDERDRPTAWSAPAWWEMGLLAPADWKAQWIEPALPEDPAKDNPPPLLRREFQLHGKLRSARAYIASRGLYELYLNGHRVGNDLLTPGWTSYGSRLAYRDYDVTALLADGANAAAVALGDGWYRGTLLGGRNRYGKQLGLLLQIHLVYDDGREENLVSDGSWKSATGPIRMSEIYAGETYDARLEQPGWSSPGFDDSGWSGVNVVPASGAVLFAAIAPPVRRQEELKPVRIFKAPSGETIADMGQNMVGWVRLKVQGPAGTEVRLRHGEVLDPDGNLYTANLRGAAQTVRYTLGGHGVETFEPHFTYQGFRYVAVEGYPGPLTADSLTGVVLHADMARTGAFETSDPLLNQLQHNIVWSEKGNFLAVPSDCPQRDERLGWTGDAQVFAPTAAFNMDVDRFYAAWMADVAADQFDDGAVPFAVPAFVRYFNGHEAGGAAGWGDVATVVPWTLYRYYGDAGELAAQYPSMRRWLEFERGRAGGKLIWSGDFQFGDWLDFGSETRKRMGATSPDLIATAYFAHSADLVSQAAGVLGKSEDQARYAELAARVRAAFVKQFVGADGRIGNDTQTGYVLALDFDLLPREARAAAAERLAQAVRQAGHLTTGFLGTPHLLEVLSRYGHLDLAYQLLEHRDFPSWLYPVTHGATTIWERWDGTRPDGSFQDASMNSFNHYAYGAVGQWMYETIAGLAPDPEVPGYRHLLIRPEPGGGLSHASARHQTPYGPAEVSWSDAAEGRTVIVRLPPNTRATVLLPSAGLDDVRENGRGLADDPGVGGARQEAGTVALELGSGDYQFEYRVVP